jgi:Na+-driven multidrug efflux pump
MVAINSCLRGLNRTLWAIVMAAASVMLIDVPLGVGLVTNGLALTSVILLLAPRDAPWNLRYLNPSPQPAAV